MTSHTHLHYYLAFSKFLGIGPYRFKYLIDTFGSVEKAFKADAREFEPILGLKLAEDFIKFKTKCHIQQELENYKKQNIVVITQEDPTYPPELLSISDPPICLYAKGNTELLKDLSKCIGIVGTRRATTYGLTVTDMITHDLVHHGFTIVSGLALGIDSQAHKTTLKNKGKTIAVLGCGVDIIYPPSNKDLYEQIKKHGLILSEFPPGQTVLPGLFIARNRIISALSKGVLVVEGNEKSGALITARFAASQGRDVYAIPCPITSSLSKAPNLLLKEGAKLVTDSKDIIEDYNILINYSDVEKSFDHFFGVEKQIVESLSKEALSTDELALNLTCTISSLLPVLSSLELQEVIKKSDDGRYYLNRV